MMPGEGWQRNDGRRPDGRGGDGRRPDGRWPDEHRLDRLYSRYRATLLYASACILAGRQQADARRQSAELEEAARREAARGGPLQGPFELGARASARLTTWVAADLRGTATAAEMEAVREGHRSFRSAVWAVTGRCEYAPCGTERQPALRG